MLNEAEARGRSRLHGRPEQRRHPEDTIVGRKHCLYASDPACGITPAMLAANRANGQKWTGPRTVRGKRCIVLNALNHGRYAHNFRDHLLRTRSKEDAELFQWILDQVHSAFRFRGWQAERQAERLARQVWCEPGHEERRAHAACGTRQWGRGQVKFRRRSASLWALAWTPLRLGGVGTNPEYAVKSTDRFLTCLSRIRVEIHDGRTVRLKLWVRRSPLRPLPLWAVAAAWGFDQAWAAAGG